MTPSITAWPPTMRSLSGVLIALGYERAGDFGEIARSLMHLERPTESRRLRIVIANVGCANPSIQGLFRGGSALGCRFLAVTLIKAIDASRGIDQLLLTREERVAGGTDFHVQVALLGRARFERLAAGAGNGYLNVFRVNSWFHYSLIDSL